MQLLPTLRRRDGGLMSAWPDFDLLEDQMQRLMRSVPLRTLGAESLIWAPRVDFSEEDGRYVLTAELPGVELKDVDIEVEGNVLSIRGEKKLEREHADERVQIAERRYGSFERTFTLPSSADPEKVSADFHQGVLKVQIEKCAEAKGKKIEVKAK
jgi:HSP20 family protein